MNKQNRNKLIDTENNWWLPDEWGVGGVGEKVEAINKYKLVLQNSHGDVEYNIENIVNNIVTIIYDVRWVLD